MSGTIEEFVAEVYWPDDKLASQFILECDLFWGTEVGRRQILSWKTLMGKPSQFLQRQLWTVSDLIEHNRLHDEWVQQNKIVEDEEEEAQQERLAPAYGDARQIKEAAKKWHEAVQQRRLNISLSKEWSDGEIDRIRKKHTELDNEWTAYISVTREELKRLRGY